MKSVRQIVYDALSSHQRPETIDRKSKTRFGVKSGGVEKLEPPDDLVDLVNQIEETPLLKAPVRKYASDTLSHGVRIEADDQRTVDFFMGGDEAPNETPPNGFLSQAAIIAGEMHKDFAPFTRMLVEYHESRGTILIEHVREDKEDPNSNITGFKYIDPLTIKPIVYKNQTILIDPEDSGDDIPTTRRGEAAAYVQFDEESALGKAGQLDDDSETIFLSQNDVTKISRDPQPGSVLGQPCNTPVSDRVTAFKDKLLDNEAAIKTKAYGIWSVAFGRELIYEHLEYSPNDEPILEEWGEEEQRQFIEDKIGNLEPGEIVGHDGLIDFNRFEGEIASGLLEFLELDVKYILSALPVPKYLTGFEDDVNRDVTSEQSPSYQQSVEEMRQTLERELTPMFRQVAEQRDLDTTGLKLKLEPEVDDSPVLSLTDEEVQRVQNYAQAVDRLENSSLLEDKEIRKLILQLPEEPDESLTDEEVEETVDEIDESVNGHEEEPPQLFGELPEPVEEADD